MKLARLEFDGFRCFREKRELKLKDGRSLCLQAENGRGKTSIADALEFWSTGDVGWTHRDGVGLAALIHLDRDEAMVEVRVDGVGVASRRLRSGSADPLEAGAGPLAVDFAAERLPVLRYRTMAQFVDKSANDKRGELLEALGLEDLGAFRAGVRSVKAQLKRVAKDARQQQEAAAQAFNAELGEEKLEAALARLSASAKLDPKLGDGDDLVAWTPPTAHVLESNSPLSRVQEVISAREELEQAPVNLWATATQDRVAAEQRGLSTLLEAGSQILATSSEDRCPLCLIEQDREALIDRVTERAAQLATADEKFREAEEQLAKHEEAVRRLARALENLLGDDNVTPPDHAEALGVSLAELHGYLEKLGEARAQRRPLPTKVPLPHTKASPKLAMPHWRRQPPSDPLWSSYQRSRGF